MDLFALNDFTINPIERVKVDTGIAIRVPKGYVGLIKEKSGLSLQGIEVKAGVLDEGYSDSVSVVLYMSDGYELDGKKRKSNEPKTFKAGQKIAQLVVVPVSLGEIIEVDELPESERGTGGWGSTGS